ncbi:MAG: glycosyltransferase, partial [Flavobacteriales bacterium]
MSISIIIPTYNEEGQIGDLINHIKNVSGTFELNEIIVVDG